MPEPLTDDSAMRQIAPDDSADTRDPGSREALEHDLSVLAWLQDSPQLSQEATGYVCDAFLEWALFGEPWPDAAEPTGALCSNHFAVLREVAERLAERINATQPAARRFALARVVRHVQTAVQFQRVVEAGLSSGPEDVRSEPERDLPSDGRRGERLESPHR